MRLADFLSTEGLTPAKFAELLKRDHELEVTGEAVRLWAEGSRIPRRQAMGAIQAATGGKVGSADFFGEAA